MLTPSQAGFRRLLPLLRPHLRQLLMGAICMVIYVLSFPLLVQLAGQLEEANPWFSNYERLEDAF